MNFEQAKVLLDEGKRVRLPEWTGYWFKKGDEYYAFTRTGDIFLAWLDKYEKRDDWQEVVSEGLGYDWVVLALKSEKLVRRKNWADGAFVFKGAGNTVSKDYIPNFKSMPKSVIQFFLKRDKDIVFKDSFDFVDGNGDITRGYFPTAEDMLAEDWVVLN